MKARAQLTMAPDPSTTLPRSEGVEGVACAHCSLPVPRGMFREGEDAQYCCESCRAVAEMIRGCGLDAFYRLREATGGTEDARPASRAGRAFEELDADSFRELYCTEEPDGMRSCELQLEGVHCAACVWLVERLPELTRGVLSARLELGRALVRLRWNPEQTTLSEIARRLDGFGYIAHPARAAGARAARRLEDRRALIRIGVAGACMGNVMLVSIALYAGLFEGIEDSVRMLFHWVSVLVGILAIAWPGSVFFRGALASARRGAWHLDQPIALGLSVGAVTGLINAVRGSDDIYFDSLTMLVFLLLIGRWARVRHQRGAVDSVELLYAFTPRMVRVVEGEDRRSVPVESVVPGSLVAVEPGESIPVDGVVCDGSSSVDASILTGEAAPVRVETGASVTAGAVNIASPIVVRAEAIGAETRVGQIMRTIERLASGPTPIIGAADRLAGWFVGTVLLLSGACFGVWLHAGLEVAASHAIALLIITCPCALALSTPLATTVAIGRAARRGLLVKGGDALESLAGGGVMFLDKTGTVTVGRFALRDWTGDEALRPLVGALETRSKHPIARALATDDEMPVDDIEERPGLGITGIVDGQRLALGSPALMQHLGVEIPDWATEASDQAAASGRTPVLIGVEERVEALAELGDELKSDAPETVRALAERGWDVRLLSGDAPGVVADTARRLDLDAANSLGGVSPEQKLDVIDSVASGATRVMVGDGVNDAAALARADVGIGVRGGAEACLSASDVYISADGLGPLLTLVDGAKRTVRSIRLNLGVSLAYNSVAAVLAFAGLVSPLLGAVLMPLSSITVVALSVRARTFQEADS